MTYLWSTRFLLCGHRTFVRIDAFHNPVTLRFK